MQRSRVGAPGLGTRHIAPFFPQTRAMSVWGLAHARLVDPDDDWDEVGGVGYFVHHVAELAKVKPRCRVIVIAAKRDGLEHVVGAVEVKADSDSKLPFIIRRPSSPEVD